MQNGAELEEYYYDQAGRRIIVRDGSGNFLRGEIYAGARHLATYQGWSTTYFNHADWLGTERVRTNVAGAVCETVVSLAFGDGQTTSGSCGDPSPSHFTGLIRDAESGLDYTRARQYTSNLGHWTTPDPLGLGSATPSDPQTWNMYAYAGNNPTTNTDPSGETYHVCQIDANGNQTNCTDISDQQFAQFAQQNKDTLAFTGNGSVLQNGTAIGTYQQTSVDLSSFASGVIAGVNANRPGDLIAGVAEQAVIAGVTGGAADAFLGGLFEGLGLAGEGTQTLGIAGAEGASSDYTDVTRPSAKVPNRLTNVSAQEFGDNLKADGYKESVEGNIAKYAKGNTQYTVYRAASTGGPSAQVKIGGKMVATIRLQP